MIYGKRFLVEDIMLNISHSEDEDFDCPLCPEQKFSKPALFIKHIDTKHQKRYMYNCSQCGKGFHSKTLCSEHMNVHLGVKPFRCIVCNAGFTYTKSVVTHQLKAHRVEILGKAHTTECTFCRNRFVSVASLERHVQQVHSGPKRPKEKIHLCDICGMGFAKKNKMVVHQRVHTGVKPYSCRYCEKSFSKSGERNCHERIHTGERPFSCEYCGKAFRQSAPFKVHIRTHTGERPYVCELCTKGFTTNQGLRLHKRNCTSGDAADDNYVICNIKNEDCEEIPIKKEFKCPKCPKTFSTSGKLKAHRKIHLKSNKDFVETHTYKFDFLQDLYICNTCSAEFQQETEAKDHIKNIHEKEYSCSQCNKNFKTLYEMGAHSSDHHPQGHVACPLCTYKSPKKGSLLIHINYVHLKKFSYFCQTCGKGFNDHLLFKEHANEHLGVRPFGCVVCGKTFTYTRYLYTHQVRAHRVSIDGILLPNQCSYCNRKYSKSETLEKHMEESHLKQGPHEKKHLCETCGKGFAQRSKLVIHERVHTGYKPYACAHCGKCFTKKDYLVMHERVHSGEKPYGCEYCGKRFSQGAPLRIHLRIHTGEKPYECSLCKARFSSKSALKCHKNCIYNSKKRGKGRPKKLLSCPKCPKTKFKTQKLANLHKHFHQDSSYFNFDKHYRVFSCLYCQAEFSKKKKALEHSTKHSINCEECSEQCDNAFLLSLHMAKHNEENKLVCPLCNSQTHKSVLEIRKHIAKEHFEDKPEMLQCDTCNKQFTKIKDLRNHQKLHKVERLESLYTFNLLRNSYSCDTCLQEFPTKQDIDVHVETHSYTCPVCSKKFKKALLIGLHMAEHNDEGIISCPMCSHDFKTKCKSRLIRHIRQTHQKERPKTSQCEYCGSSYLSKTMLEDHIRVVHLQKEPYKCIVCGNTFTLQSSMRIHQINKHRVVDESEMSSNYCALCKMSFKRPTSLAKHLEMKRCIPTPRVERQGHFVCDLCGKEFRFYKTFNLHLRDHAGDKPYKCSFCPKSFVINSKRLSHEVSHTDQRPFSCETCGQSYKTWKHLRRHLVVHGTQLKATVNCAFCGQEFGTKETQRAHMKICDRSKPVNG
ncbi:unnamed protein product [Ceutorhynchus assimilis]|uniref:C2H2-type domain-containing protein n=1 Tax=Ceutorhynchus assimilis TaxID=467358 RepID=A0A9N9QFW8_9CUCU|nr:unnamed protein product [Ceutorhynchus assimilis]